MRWCGSPACPGRLNGITRWRCGRGSGGGGWPVAAVWPTSTRTGKALKPVPFGTAAKVAKSGGDTAVLRFPKAKIRADEHGIVALVRTIPKVGRQEFEDRAEHIANSWRCDRVSVSQSAPGRLIVRGMRKDPLLTPFGLEAAPAGLSARHLWLGRDEHGDHRFADLANCPGIVVGGMPGAGKSTELTSWLTQLAPCDAVQMMTIDGKGAGEFDDFDPRAVYTEGDDLDRALAVLEEVHDLMTARLAAVRTTLGFKNAWHVGPAVDWPLLVLVLDECQTFLDAAAVKGDKDREPKVRRCIALVSSLVRKQRSAMMLTIVATQKPTTDCLPSSIRDNCPLSLCFGVKTIDVGGRHGGHLRSGTTRAIRPVSLADPVYAGCCTVTMRTGADPFTRLRGPWVSEDQAAVVARAHAGLRRPLAAPLVVPDDASSLVP